MTHDRALAPGVRVALTARLADRARPARGRIPLERFVFAACSLDALEHTRALVTQRLEERAGPLRCTAVAVEVAVGSEDTAELLADLNANRGQTTDTLAPVVTAYGQTAAAAQRLGLGDAVLVVASCGVLTGQAYADPHAS